MYNAHQALQTLDPMWLVHRQRGEIEAKSVWSNPAGPSNHLWKLESSSLKEQEVIESINQLMNLLSVSGFFRDIILLQTPTEYIVQNSNLLDH